MAKITFGEYGAFTTKNMIRFQKNNKLVSENSVPPEVVAFLRKKLEPTLLRKIADEMPETPHVPLPEVHAPSHNQGFKAGFENAIEVTEQLSDNGDDMWDEVAPQEEVTEEIIEEVASSLSEEDFALPPELGIVSDTPEPAIDPDFMEAVSIHTADLEDIANALYERFGIYSVYLRKMPAADEINPLTGEQFTKYHLGIAYQAAIRAQHSGVFRRAPEQARVAIDANRAAAQDHRAAFVPLPTTLGEAKKQDSFAYRTSVRGSSGYGQQSSQGELVNVRGEDGEVRSARLDVDPNVGSPSGMVSVQPDGRFDLDEPLAEPPFRGKKIIRPNW